MNPIKQQPLVSLDESLATEEDIESAVVIAEEVLGLQGQYDLLGNRPNVVVSTNRFGKIWYGDTDTSSLQILAEKLHDTLIVEARYL